MLPEESLRQFEISVNRTDAQIDLAHAALLIAVDADPALDIPYYLSVLDRMANELRPRFDPAAAAIEQVSLLNDHLFGALGFRGNRDLYYDPRNSYLNDVLDRRLGIPITLSVVYMEIARRLGCPVFGVMMPAHFVVKWRTDDTVIFIDPFNEGQIIGQFAMPLNTESSEHTAMMARLRWLETASSKQILARILSNLHSIFIKTDSYAPALNVIEKILVLEPRAAELKREAALVAYRLGLYLRARHYLQEYLAKESNPDQADQLQNLLNRIEEMILRVN